MLHLEMLHYNIIIEEFVLAIKKLLWYTKAQKSQPIDIPVLK
jgi:hypothetical protein